MLHPNPLEEGLEAFHAGDFAQAFDCFHRAASALIDIPKAEALHLAGLSLARFNRTSDAEKFFREALTVAPDLAESNFELGALYAIKSEWSPALQHFDAAIAAKPSWSLPFFNRGLVHEKKGNRELAIDDFTRGLELEPENSGARSSRASLFMAAEPLTWQDVDSALEDLSVAIATAGTVDLYLQRAEILTRVGQHEDAIPDFTSAIDLSSGQSDTALIGRGIALRNLGDLAASLSDLQQVKVVNPNHTRADMQLGVTLGELGLLDEALEAFNRALEIDPGCPGPLYNRGAMFAKLGRHREAVSDFTHALVSRGFASFYQARAESYFELGEFSSAIADCKTVLESDPDNQRAKGLLQKME